MSVLLLLRPALVENVVDRLGMGQRLSDRERDISVGVVKADFFAAVLAGSLPRGVVNIVIQLGPVT